MSLDLSLACKHCNSEPITFNYTYNVSPMWFSCRPDDKVMVPIEGLTGEQSIEILSDVIGKLDSDPKRFYAMQPENKWGSYPSFLKWLISLKAAALEHQDMVWRASR